MWHILSAWESSFFLYYKNIVSVREDLVRNTPVFLDYSWFPFWKRPFMLCLYSHSFIWSFALQWADLFLPPFKSWLSAIWATSRSHFLKKFFKPHFFFPVNTVLLGSKYKSMYVINQHLEISKKAPFNKWKRLLLE